LKKKSRADTLLLNILPASVTKELLEKGRVDAREFEHVTVLFTDFVSFTKTTRQMPPQELLQELNTIFQRFDEIVARHNISKIKSIGDAYMAAGGLPVSSADTVKQIVLTALEMQEYIEKRYAERHQTGQLGFQMRVGIHHGPVIAGIVGFHNFQYDIWGDTVNIASRVEKGGEKGRVNISKDVYMHIADDPTFRFVSRGAIDVKGKGNIEMWFVEKVDGFKPSQHETET
jgi:class 3 adenylate cyclase